MSKRIPIAEGLFTWPSDNPALLASRCNGCGIASFPAAESCMACSGQDVSLEELPGGVRGEGRLPARAPGKLRIGRPMDVVFDVYRVEDNGDEVVGFFFQPAQENA